MDVDTGVTEGIRLHKLKAHSRGSMQLPHMQLTFLISSHFYVVTLLFLGL